MKYTIPLEEYLKIKRSLKTIRDVGKPPYPRGMLHTILLQKKVESVKRKYHAFAARIDEIVEYWKRFRKFPRWLTLTPVMKVRLLLKGLGYSVKMTSKLLKEPEKIEDEDLRKIIVKAVIKDYVYSPLAVKLHHSRGKLGEKIIEIELEKLGVEFKTERELKGKFPKTPDFFFEDPVTLDGREIRWIESKAMFGDPKTHQMFEKKQYSKYRELFGEGYVVYWFGCVEGIDSFVFQVKSTLKYALFDMKIYISDSPNLELAEKLNAEIVEVEGKTIEAAAKIIDAYSNGRVFAVHSDPVKIGRVLKNMGFDVIYRKSLRKLPTSVGR